MTASCAKNIRMSDRKTPHKIEVGIRLRILMAELEILTAKRLAEVVGGERSAADNWLNGVAFPPPEAVRKLGEVYKLPLFDWLFTGSPVALPTQVWIRLSARMEGLVPPPVFVEGSLPAVDVQPAVPAKGRRAR